MIRPFITPAFQPDNTSNTTASRNAGFIPYRCNQKDSPASERAIASILSRLTEAPIFIHLYTRHISESVKRCSTPFEKKEEEKKKRCRLIYIPIHEKARNIEFGRRHFALKITY